MKKGLLKEVNAISVEITTQELADLIENVMEAIDKTKIGPLVEYGGTAENPQKIVNQVAFPIFLAVLDKILGKVDTITLIPDAPPSEIIASLN